MRGMPTETALSRALTPYHENLDDYRVSLIAGVTEPWAAAKQSTVKSQETETAV